MRKCHVELAKNILSSYQGNSSQTGFSVFLNVFLYSTCLNSKHVPNMFCVFNSKHAMFQIVFWMIWAVDTLQAFFYTGNEERLGNHEAHQLD